jgi:hypothetical protein
LWTSSENGLRAAAVLGFDTIGKRERTWCPSLGPISIRSRPSVIGSFK